MDYEQTLKEEVKTWLIDDPTERAEKYLRERIRHPQLIKDLLLDHLPTHRMDILEVGGGPEPVSDLLKFRSRIIVDPCTEEYKKYWPCKDHVPVQIEKVSGEYFNEFDLVISTNSLDHVEWPLQAIYKMNQCLRPGGFLAIMCAENNAITNPHPCHVHNLTAEWVHYALDSIYETVWELNFAKDNYRYGWATYEGRVGQPAFALLMRKVTGYGD